MRSEIFEYVRKCESCQRDKPAQTTRVGFHSAELSSRPMERLFIDFMGPLVRSKRGNTAILVVVDGFSKFVRFYPTRALTAQVVCDKLGKLYFPAYGTPSSVVSDNAQAFRSRLFRDMFPVGDTAYHHYSILPSGISCGASKSKPESRIKDFLSCVA